VKKKPLLGVGVQLSARELAQHTQGPWFNTSTTKQAIKPLMIIFLGENKDLLGCHEKGREWPAAGQRNSTY
jgi:hypothetical protein